MSWKTLLAYITGTVDQELLMRNEYPYSATYELPPVLERLTLLGSLS